MSNTPTNLFEAIEAVLRDSPGPMDCHQLFTMSSVKQFAKTTNRVSDYLGGLWRKGLVTRQRADPESDTKARWVYAWKGNKGPKMLDAIEYTPKVIADRPSVLITEQGNVITLEFPNLVISIRQKAGK